MFSISVLRVLSTAALVVVTVSAAPAPYATAVPSPNSTQIDGHLFVCTDANFTGICANIGFSVGQCINFVSPLQDTISSFGPDSGFVCTTYTDVNCVGSTYTAIAPGFTNLPNGINDAISSFVCFRA